MAQPQEAYERITVKWENIYDEYICNPFPIEKLNLFDLKFVKKDKWRERGNQFLKNLLKEGVLLWKKK